MDGVGGEALFGGEVSSSLEEEEKSLRTQQHLGDTRRLNDALTGVRDIIIVNEVASGCNERHEVWRRQRKLHKASSSSGHRKKLAGWRGARRE